ncbi:urease accessory protein UreE [Candidatus Erwinia dacicola]|uniref:Urease accessory protein UreE n=1 Tax=Candidatus Erwinia dacicola TaxID=252393 RepID=A0A1E7YYG8_9GAMM|nr:urease accessory protein UreE [Candidatus Erwinia dacicola]NJD00387.1 urease accessory protein UreE [Candidatus Erwinia dacicola]NJD84889.1 urease accessory protein UreE [Candidatus Erwinia dacicola]OFC61553.1 urease accessory protein UreE [Candidatus Erwinia dacicola]RAP71591.1 urease accessory protein UreE [Candidatus Erwinia dacicola]
MYLLTRKLVSSDKISTTATLDFDTRLKSRACINLNNGSVAGLHLERGSLLRGGDILSDDSGQFVVNILAAPEHVSFALCEDPLKLSIACYHLGNRHVSLQIEAGRVTYLHDHVLDKMLIGLGLIVGEDNIPFEPVSGAYETGSRHHHQH